MLFVVPLLITVPLGAQTFQLAEATIHDVHTALRAGEITCRELVQLYFDRIDAYDQQGPQLNAIQSRNEQVFEEADALDLAMQTDGMVGPLHCIPVLLKDQVETKDMPTTFGSALFQDFISFRDATIVTRLKAAGGIILAKTTMGEFASRYVGSAFGVIRNAYDPTRNPSGSSGGSATGIAANFGMIGIGEDTGGSVRGPAAVHSLVGLRPTLELVSRHGMMPANPTQDTMGPITRTVTDAAIVMDAIAGYDSEDPITAYSVGYVPETYTASLNVDQLRGARIGVLRTPMDTRTDRSSNDYQKVQAVFDRAVRELAALGAEVLDPLVIPELETSEGGGYGNNFETERATNEYLAEHQNAKVSTLREILLSGVVVPLRERAMMGYVGRSTDEVGYLEVIHKREELRRGVLKIMADKALDAIVYATFDHQPTLIPHDVETNPYPADDYGWGDNRGLSPAVGFPALTVPAGFTTDELPVGLEFLGRPFTEEKLLGFGYAFEQATHYRQPPPNMPPVK